MANVNPDPEMTNYENWQLKFFGNIISSAPAVPDEEFEAGISELNEMAAQIDTWAELQIQEASHA